MCIFIFHKMKYLPQYFTLCGMKHSCEGKFTVSPFNHTQVKADRKYRFLLYNVCPVVPIKNNRDAFVLVFKCYAYSFNVMLLFYSRQISDNRNTIALKNGRACHGLGRTERGYQWNYLGLIK